MGQVPAPSGLFFPDPRNPDQLASHKALVLSRCEVEARPGEIIQYKPHEAQKFIHYPEEPWERAVCCWGSRSGKTMGAGMEHVVGLGIPRHRAWVVAPTYTLTDRVWDIIWEQVVRNQIYGPDSIEKASKTSQNRYIEMKWGSFVMGKSATSENSLLGEKLDLVTLDECSRMGRHIWGEYIRQRLIDRKGRALFISTPHGLNWFKEFFLRGRNPEHQKRGWQSLRFPTTDNPFIDRQWLLEKRREMTDLEWRQEILAEFVSFAGLIYPDFVPELHPKGHLYDASEHRIDSQWTHYRAIDIGTSHPTVCLWGAVDPRGWVWVYREYHEVNRSHDDHAKQIVAMTDQPIAQTFLPKDSKRTSNKTVDDNLSVWDIYRKEGIYAHLASDEWHAGKSLVTRYLRATREDHPSEPGVLISQQECPRLIEAMQMYSWPDATGLRRERPPDKPRTSKDDAPDALRYLLASSPRHRELDRMPDELVAERAAKRYGYPRSKHTPERDDDPRYDRGNPLSIYN